jgi:hypothetical protein
MLPFYAYLNWLFRRIMTPREGDGTKILTYNKNILATMAPNINGFEFSVFDFIWVELKSILENPLKSCGYAPYLMHMIEKVTAQTARDSCAPRQDGRSAIHDRLIWWDKISQLIHSARSGRTGYGVEWLNYRWTNNHSSLWSRRQGAHDRRCLTRCEVLRHAAWWIF